MSQKKTILTENKTQPQKISTPPKVRTDAEKRLNPKDGDTIYHPNGDKEVYKNATWVIYPTASPFTGN